jgi:REP element-mobilizing transposase RayT
MGDSCLGRLVELCWRDIPKHFPATNVDVFQIMPNHLHGIITIKNPVGVELVQPLQVPSFQHVVPNSLGSIVRSFKAAVTRMARDEEQWGRDALWQRNYFEHIIRDDVSFFWIQRYIEMNPQLWDSDYDNPQATDRTEDYLEEGLRRHVGDNNQGNDHIMSCEVAYRRWLVKEEEAIA